MESKAAGIEQFRKGDSLARVLDDVAGEAANAAEMKAAATGNELIFLQVKLAAELKKMEGIYAAFQRGQHQLERRIADLEKFPDNADNRIEQLRSEIALRDENTFKDFCFAAGGRIYDEKTRKDLLPVIGLAMKNAVQRPEQLQKAGLYRGFTLHVEAGGRSGCQFVLEGRSGPHYPQSLSYQAGEEFSLPGFFQRLDNYLASFEKKIEELGQEKIRKAAELVTARWSRGQAFPQMALLEALRKDNREVMAELRQAQKNPDYKSNWVPLSRNQPPKGLSPAPLEAKSGLER